MAAAHEQRDERKLGRRFGYRSGHCGRIGFATQEDREQVPDQVIDPDDRQRLRERERLTDLKTDEQRAHEPRPVRDCDPTQPREPTWNRGERTLDDRQNIFHVCARSELRNDATVRGMQLDLTCNDVRQHEAVGPHDCSGSLVTG